MAWHSVLPAVCPLSLKQWFSELYGAAEQWPADPTHVTHVFCFPEGHAYPGMEKLSSGEAGMGDLEAEAEVAR